MPECILKFQLPEEKNALRTAIKGKEWAEVVYQLDKYLRDEFPVQEHKFSNLEELAEIIRNELWRLLTYYNLSFDEIDG